MMGTIHHQAQPWRSQKAWSSETSPLKTLRSMGWAMLPK